jgi:heme exporter protein D
MKKHLLLPVVFLLTMFFGWMAIQENFGHFQHITRNGETLNMGRQAVFVFVMMFVCLLTCIYQTIKTGKEHQHKLNELDAKTNKEREKYYLAEERRREAEYSRRVIHIDTSKMTQWEAKAVIEQHSQDIKQ